MMVMMMMMSLGSLGLWGGVVTWVRVQDHQGREVRCQEPLVMDLSFGWQKSAVGLVSYESFGENFTHHELIWLLNNFHPIVHSALR
jgi:hypothetical protein